jgi:iron complex transport system permease protein
LVGIAVGFGIGAVTLVFSLRMDPNVYRFAVVWLAGTISATTWSYVLALLPWTTVLVPLTIYKAKVLNVLNLGDQVAVRLGASVEW